MWFRPAGDHPRVCGEHILPHHARRTDAGSSPRMRGTRAVCCDGDDRIGIIPAYAGNTRKAHPKPQTGRDHPRVCGEHARQRHGRACKTGSSPRMRGTRMWKSARTVRAGIIPAYAGNTRPCRPYPTWFWDHPRVCGEHADLREHDHIGRGSSPRMRGTPTASGVGVPLIGIIPAYAGNTPTHSYPTVIARDHPRVCGEHLMDVCHANSDRGSSPRMRGTHCLGLPCKLLSGIIPAYAGNTPAETTSDCYNWDHPRVCGEHIKSFAMFAVR